MRVKLNGGAAARLRVGGYGVDMALNAALICAAVALIWGKCGLAIEGK